MESWSLRQRTAQAHRIYSHACLLHCACRLYLQIHAKACMSLQESCSITKGAHPPHPSVRWCWHHSKSDSTPASSVYFVQSCRSPCQRRYRHIQCHSRCHRQPNPGLLHWCPMMNRSLTPLQSQPPSQSAKVCKPKLTQSTKVNRCQPKPTKVNQSQPKLTQSTKVCNLATTTHTNKTHS